MGYDEPKVTIKIGSLVTATNTLDVSILRYRTGRQQVSFFAHEHGTAKRAQSMLFDRRGISELKRILWQIDCELKYPAPICKNCQLRVERPYGCMDRMLACSTCGFADNHCLARDLRKGASASKIDVAVFRSAGSSLTFSVKTFLIKFPKKKEVCMVDVLLMPEDGRMSCQRITLVSKNYLKFKEMAEALDAELAKVPALCERCKVRVPDAEAYLDSRSECPFCGHKVHKLPYC